MSILKIFLYPIVIFLLLLVIFGLNLLILFIPSWIFDIPVKEVINPLYAVFWLASFGGFIWLSLLACEEIDLSL